MAGAEAEGRRESEAEAEDEWASEAEDEWASEAEGVPLTIASMCCICTTYQRLLNALFLSSINRE